MYLNVFVCRNLLFMLMIPILGHVLDLDRFYCLLIQKNLWRIELVSNSLFRSCLKHFHVPFQIRIHFQVISQHVSCDLNLVKNYQKMRHNLINQLNPIVQKLFDLCLLQPLLLMNVNFLNDYQKIFLYLSFLLEKNLHSTNFFYLKIFYSLPWIISHL